MKHIYDISLSGKYKGKSFREIFSGTKKLPEKLIVKNIGNAISWLVPEDYVKNIEVTSREIRLPKMGLSRADTRFINYWIRKSLNFFFVHPEHEWNCYDFEKIDCPECYYIFQSMQGDPLYIKELIENDENFALPNDEMRELEHISVNRFQKFKLHYKNEYSIGFQPVMKAFHYKFSRETKQINEAKNGSFGFAEKMMS